MTDDAGKDLARLEKVVPSFCSSHCGGACFLRVHVKGGVITRIESDDNRMPPFRACLRGRAYRQRVYHPDRLKYPMKRVGARGEGTFQRISWDEALNTVAGEMKRVKESYGNSALILSASCGDVVLLHAAAPFFKIFNMIGGYSNFWGTISYEAALFAEYATYGTTYTRSGRDDLLNSSLIIMWGWNPAVSIQDTPTSWVLAEAKKSGARIVCVDPRFTDSAATFADRWIPVRPGTDAAMLIAMAFVMIRENLQDQRFLDTYTVGFSQFKDYVLGSEDGIAKTPSWAEAITGVPASVIEQLAREYATMNPAALMAGIGAGRTAYGEQYHRAAMTVAAMTGNIGIHGGNAAGRSHTTMMSLPFMIGMPGIVPDMPNPLLFETPFRKCALRAYFDDPLYGWSTARGHVNRIKIADAILKGKAGDYPSDYKLLFLVNHNILNQSPNYSKTAEALRHLEFIVDIEQFMTATARFADILLPANTFLERNDIAIGEGIPVYGYQNKVIDSLYESRSHVEIAIELAKHLGISDFCTKSEDELLRMCVAGAPIPSYEVLQEKGIHRVSLAEPYVAFKRQIDDPANNPFPTPSGKIEIFSQEIAGWNNPDIPPVPKYLETWESRSDPLAKKYPLQMITTHFKRRAHSQFENVPWLKELEPQAILISSADAQARGIKDGDRVLVFNDRGKLKIIARVTERIMPGVVDIPQGAWYSPDENGVDTEGCCNILTKDENSPGGAFVTNTCLVEVQRMANA